MCREDFLSLNWERGLWVRRRRWGLGFGGGVGMGDRVGSGVVRATVMYFCHVACMHPCCHSCTCHRWPTACSDTFPSPNRWLTGYSVLCQCNAKVESKMERKKERHRDTQHDVAPYLHHPVYDGVYELAHDQVWTLKHLLCLCICLCNNRKLCKTWLAGLYQKNVLQPSPTNLLCQVTLKGCSHRYRSFF